MQNINAPSLRKRCPCHPGHILKNLYMEPLAITLGQLASSLNISVQTIASIVQEQESITPELALRLSQAFPNTTPQSWLNLQNNHDVWKAANVTSAWKMVQPIQNPNIKPLIESECCAEEIKGYAKTE
jgi:antitoxin HigA-1